MKRKLYDKLMTYAKKNPDGFVIKIKDGKIKHIKANKLNRYVVSKTNNNTNQKIKQSFRNDNYEGYVSGKVNKKTGKITINKNLIFKPKDIEKAIKSGYRYNQLNIFDLYESKPIKIQKEYNEWKTKQSKIKKKQAKVKKPVVLKKGKYYNTITKRYVSKTYAKRINSYFSKHPESTLHEGMGHGKYELKKSLTEHSKEIRKMAYGKGTQLIKTKTKEGKIIYFSPFLHEQVSTEKIKNIKKLDYKICNGKVDVELYRMTRIKDNIYHMITWNLNQRLVSPNMVDIWSINAYHIYNCITSELRKINKKYPFSKISIMYGHVSCYFTSKYDAWEHGKTFGFCIPNKSGFAYLKKDFQKLLDFYKNRLEIDAYHNIIVVRISFYLYDDIDNVSKQAIDIAKYRIGVNRIME